MTLVFPPWPGKLDNRFVARKPGGRGSFSEVFQAKDLEHNNLVAIKVLTKASGSDRFQREIELLKTLSTSFVVKYISDGHLPSGQPYVALEWLSGRDLQRLMEVGRLRIASAVRIIAQAARGLGELHNRGIVHRDIKPANIFVSRVDGLLEAKIIDLGIARNIDWRTITRIGALLGTPFYISPELAASEIKVGPPSDVYGLCSVLYELVCGRKPFVTSQIWELVGKILFEQPTPPRECNPKISPQLEAVILKGLAKVPAERQTDGNDLAQALIALGKQVQVDPQSVDPVEGTGDFDFTSPDQMPRDPLVAGARHGNLQSEPSSPATRRTIILLLDIPGKRDRLANGDLIEEMRAIIAAHGGMLTTLPGARMLGLFDPIDGREVVHGLNAGLAALHHAPGRAALTTTEFGDGHNPWQGLNEAVKLLGEPHLKPRVAIDHNLISKVGSEFQLTTHLGQFFVESKNR